MESMYCLYYKIFTMVYDAISMPYPKAKAARPPKVGASEVSCGSFDWVRDIDVLATYYRFAGNIIFI